MTKLSNEFLQRLKTIDGVKPTAPPVPPPGIYWLKRLNKSFAYWIDCNGTRLDTPTHNEIWSIDEWNLDKESEWFLAQVGEYGDYYIIGSDVDEDWEDSWSVIMRVGPKVEPPKE